MEYIVHWMVKMARLGRKVGLGRDEQEEVGIRLGDDLWTLNMQMREEGVDDNVRAETQRPGGAGVGYQGMMEKHRRRPSWGGGRGGGVPEM